MVLVRTPEPCYPLRTKNLTQLLLDRIQPRYISSFARRSPLHTTMVLVTSPEPIIISLLLRALCAKQYFVDWVEG